MMPPDSDVQPAALRAWHEVVRSGDPTQLDALLADDVVFRSPAVFKPQEGKVLATMYLTGALLVLGPTLTYVDEWSDENGAVLEFTAQLNGVEVQGIDLFRWNCANQIVNFTVFVRPLRALEKVIELMRAQLDALSS
jgi:hypothetical protein